MTPLTSKRMVAVTCCLIALTVALVWSCSTPYTTGHKGTQPGRTVSSGEGSLADIHKGMDVSCVACHGESMTVDDNETSVNVRCVACHGSLAKVAGKGGGEQINAHKAHLGDVSCTTCHRGHEASRAYCLNCHSFKMPMAGSGAVPAKAKGTGKKDGREDTTDVVIIGAGAAGFTAAITAHDCGAKVILLEKQALTGGNSILAAGGMNAAGTRMQAAKGIKDSAELMYKDTMAGGKNVSNPQLVRILAAESAESAEWLTSIGADVSDVGRLAGASVARAHRPTGGAAVGAHIINVLRRNATDRKIDVRVNSTVVKIVRDPDGRVSGVEVQGKHRGLYRINAKAVVIAAGGFSANAAMVESYRPQYKGMTTSNQPGAAGEGMKVGETGGGRLIDMKEIQIHPTVAAGSRILITEAVRGNGAILVNKEGKRFVNELTTRDAVSAAELKQQGGMAYLIFDEGIRKSLKQIEGYFHLELVKEGGTPKELAEAIGVPPGTLEATIATYNAACDSKNDSEFKRPDMPRSLKTARFYAIPVQPGIHYTMGGLKIDTLAEVIDRDGKAIPGLYAAGEVTGGVHGANRLGGNSISETITFGRIAGSNAAKVVLRK
jgi:fumarate reductase flavoprotein subunit